MKRTSLLVAAAAALLPSAAFAQAEPFIGQLMIVGFSFCPRGWQEADGSILSISANTALFSLFGTTYGGNGQTTFGLPDLRGRVPIGQGTGPGQPTMTEGEMIGTPTTTLTITQLPSHTHQLMGSTGDPDARTPTNNIMGTFPPGSPVMYSDDRANTPMNPNGIGFTGGSQPIDMYQPSLVLRYCVALEGIYPPRN